MTTKINFAASVRRDQGGLVVSGTTSGGDLDLVHLVYRHVSLHQNGFNTDGPALGQTTDWETGVLIDPGFGTGKVTATGMEVYLVCNKPSGPLPSFITITWSQELKVKRKR